MLSVRIRAFVILFNIATIVLWGAFVYAFLSRNAIEISWTVVDLYLIVLTYYAGEKEILRWRNKYRSVRRRGEYFVVGWVVTMFVMIMVEVMGGSEHGFTVPPHMGLATGGAFLIYLITTYLKTEYKRKSRVDK